MALYFIVAGVLLVAAALVAVSVPRRRPRNHVDISPQPSGRVAIQEALEGFAMDHGLGAVNVADRERDGDVGRRLNELRDAVAVIAQKQLSEAEVYLIVVKTMAVIIGLVAGVLAFVGLVVNLLS